MNFPQMLKLLRQETLKLLPMDTALQRSDEALKAMEASMGTHPGPPEDRNGSSQRFMNSLG